MSDLLQEAVTGRFDALGAKQMDMTEKNNVTGGNDMESGGLSVKTGMETKARNGIIEKMCCTKTHKTQRKLQCEGK